MIYLILVVLLNVLLAVGFKLFSRFQVAHFQAIVFNYWVCVITGSVFIGRFPLGIDSVQQDWSLWALITGLGFISVFNFFAFSTHKMGITTATVANKLSLAIPVVFSLVLYKEGLSVWHALGIVLAFPAVYLVSLSANAKAHAVQSTAGAVYWFPRLILLLLFLGSGVLDTLMKYVESHFLKSAEVQAVYTIHVFFVAACVGTFIMLVWMARGKMRFAMRNVWAGIAIGIPNFFSIYFFIRMLESNFIKSSALIPLSNIGVLFTSTLVSVLAFKERLNTAKRWGLALAVLVIFLLYMA